MRSEGFFKRQAIPLECFDTMEKIGLLPLSSRSSGAHRSYCELQEKRLHFVLRGCDLKFSLDNIEILLTLAGNEKRSRQEAVESKKE